MNNLIGGGVFELPVDFSPEPLSFDFEKYIGWFERVKNRKSIKTFNLTMHSWSLLKRDGDFFSCPAPDHEEKLRKICEHLIKETKVNTYSNYIASAYFPTVKIKRILSSPVKVNHEKTVVCEICSAEFVFKNSDVCPGCGSRSRHRQVFNALKKCGNPFDQMRVLACFANSVEKVSILGNAKEVCNFDIRPLVDVDMQMDIQDMKGLPSCTFDGFLGLHVLNHVRDDEKAVSEIFRVLRPGGVALITVPYRAGECTSPMEDILIHYGAENYARFGVASYRRYGFDDVVKLFSKYFSVDALLGVDSITGFEMHVFLLRKKNEKFRI